jgi:hypothetical protein
MDGDTPLRGGGKRPVKLMPAKRGPDTSKLPRAAGAGLQNIIMGARVVYLLL